MSDSEIRVPGWGLRVPRAMHQHPDGGGWVDTNGTTVAPSAYVDESADVLDEAVVYPEVRIHPHARIAGKMRVVTAKHYVAIGPLGSRNDYLTAGLDGDGGIQLATGCWKGTMAEFLERVDTSKIVNIAAPPEVRAKAELEGQEYLLAAEFVRALFTLRGLT